jgi:predicted DNA-binding protein with PD1-like motif
MRYHHFGSGRYVLRLDPGEEVVSSLTAFAAEAEVGAGWVTAIGSLDPAVLGFLDPKEQVYLKRTFDERMEIGSISGSMGVSADDGRPIVHLHAVLSPRELLAYSGHLHEARSGVVVECLVISMGGKITRVVDPESGFTRLVLPGEPQGAPPRAETPRGK